MMKGIIFFILLATIISAESDLTNSVDIKKIVQEQIQKAKKNEKNSVNSFEQASIKVNESDIKAAESKVKTSLQAEQPNSSIFSVVFDANSDMIKIGLLSLFSIAVFTYVGFRRAKQNKPAPVETKNDFKKNIQLVREEKFIKPIDPKLKKIRTGLCLNSNYLNTSERLLSDTARQYSIAKTELILASKFRKQTAEFN